VPVVGPAQIRFDVDDCDVAPEMGRASAGACGGTDADAVQRTGIRLGKARAGQRVQDVRGIHRQNRTRNVRQQRLHFITESSTGGFQRLTLCDHFEYRVLKPK
jgi:hypothetical protein